MSLLHGHERRILRFIERYQVRYGRTPSYEEIRKGTGMSSKDHVYRDVQTLERQNYLRREPSISRGITLLRTAEGYPVTPNGFAIPILDPNFGTLAHARRQVPSQKDWIEVTRALIPDAENVFAIRVSGDQLVDALVHDRDTIVLKEQTSAADGDLVALAVANCERGDLLIKRLEHRDGQLLLHAEDPSVPAISCRPEDVRIRGLVLCIIRNIPSTSPASS